MNLLGISTQTIKDACTYAAYHIKPPKRIKEGWCCYVMSWNDIGPLWVPDSRVLKVSTSYGAILEIISHERARLALWAVGFPPDELDTMLKGISGETRGRVRIAIKRGDIK